jgi:hypothetical protein
MEILLTFDLCIKHIFVKPNETILYIRFNKDMLDVEVKS